MAAACVLCQPERNDYALAQAVDEPWQNIVQTTFPQNANLQETFQDLIDVARELPAEEALCVDIQDLCTATLVIDQAFYDIGRKLSNATKVQNKHADLYNLCHALETKWNEHHLTYQDLLWRSREFAGEAQGAVDDFRELVLPSLRTQDKTLAEKQRTIREQIKILQDTSRPSQNLCQEFLNFGRALDTYIDEFSQIVESLEIGKHSQRISELEDRLRSARAAMEDVSREVKELGWTFAADVAIAGISLLLSFVVPALWGKLIDAGGIHVDYIKVKNSGFGWLEARRRRDLAVREYETVKAECELERTCHNQMVKLESALHDSRPLVQEVTMKLGIFASVWAAITADIRTLENSLHHAEDPTSQLFVERVQRLENMYGYLSQALRHYQVTVHLSQ